VLVGVLSVLAASGVPASLSEQETKVSEILAEACSDCHPAGDDLDLETAPFDRLIADKGETGVPMLVPGDPDGSYLMRKILGAPGIAGDPMPPPEDAEPLTAEQVTVLRSYIEGLPVPQAEPVTVRSDKKPFYGTHQINLQSTTTLGQRVLGFRVHHRFGRFGIPVKDRNGFGLASAAIISLGLEYGIIDGLDALARWSNSRLDWELGLKWVPLRQEEGWPVSFGGYASFEALGVRPSDANNRFTGNAQVMLSRLWWQRWSTMLTVGFSGLTNHSVGVVIDTPGGVYKGRDTRGTLYAGLATTVWLGKKRRHGIDAEYFVPIPDGADPNLFYYHGGDQDPGGTLIGSWSLGWMAKAGRHLFQVFVTNTRNIHTNLVAPGGDTENPFSPFGDFFLGFNLSRTWKL
jgi:hypothetical protein